MPSDAHQAPILNRDDAELFIQSLLDALAGHVAILNEHGEIIAVNAAWREFAAQNGFATNEFGLGSNYLEVCDQASTLKTADATSIASAIRQITLGQMSEFQMEYPCHSPIQRRWFVARVSRFMWYNQVRIIVLHQNVSELKLAQVELAQGKRRLEAILDNVNNGILTVNTQGRVLSLNHAAATIFGATGLELMDCNLSSLLIDFQASSETFRQLSGTEPQETQGRRRSGELFPLALSINEIRLDGELAYTCIVEELTQRRQADENRLAHERMTATLEKEREIRDIKNSFLSMMSHELRTPLTSIGLSHDILKKYGAVSSAEERDQALDNIRIQVDYLAEMVSDVLMLSRFEADGFQIDLEDTDLITYCRNVVEEFQLNYHKSHRVQFECEERILIVPIDRKLLRRALTNLLSNAIKYSPAGGRVLFELAREHECAVIRVTDSGIGIPSEDQTHLFQPFHRATNVKNLPGTGLGLPVTKQMVELHHGSIRFVSTEQIGTTFTVCLPLLPAQP